ncbi:uncharacterized protein [Eurosta solidaginis]|uniref:uncharacterized protein n=1 Tax=Eurosta solidaginis TaxID=178769 RepID=UPI003530C7F2
MKRKMLRKRRVKQSTNLVELIRNRPRHQQSYYSSARNKQRNGKVKNNTNLSAAPIFQSQNNTFLSQKHQTAVLICDISPSFNASLSRTNNTFGICRESHCNVPEKAIYKPTELPSISSGRIINSLFSASNLSINESCGKVGIVTSNVTSEKQCETKSKFYATSGNGKSHTTVPVGHENKVSSDNIVVSKLFSHSSIELNSQKSEILNSISKELTGENSSYKDQIAEHQQVTTAIEEAPSIQVLPDEEAGGDGHHNNSIIEIEITLHSSNDTNSEDEDEDGGENLHGLSE